MSDHDSALKAAEELVAALKEFKDKNQAGNTAAHLELLRKTDAVRTALEDPYDTITHHFEVASAYSSIWTFLRIGALDALPPTGTKTAKELATACNVDESLIARAGRILVFNGFLTEPNGGDVFAHTPLSLAYRYNAFGGYLVNTVDATRAQLALPDYAKSHSPEDLFDLRKTPHCFVRGKEPMTYYECLSENPEDRDRWNKALQVMDKNMPTRGMFPFPTLKEQVEKETDRPFIVDIGGGRGQALLAIREECGGSYGAKLILQDLPDVVNDLKEEDIPGIDKMVYDVFSGPQPIKNAHVYFLRRLLHDFYGPVCVEILKNTVSAMGLDSRVIICDMLVPEKVEVGGAQEVYCLDWALLCMAGGEKTLKQFNEIFDEVGLELVKIYPSGIGATVMLEARLKQA